MISYYNPFFDDGIVYSCDNLRLSFEFLSSDSGEHFLSWLSQFEYAYYRSSKPFAYKHLFVFGCKDLVMNHQFNWWFDYAPIRGLCLQRLKGGCLKHLYRLASKRGYLLVSSLFDSSFCC